MFEKDTYHRELIDVICRDLIGVMNILENLFDSDLGND